MFRVEVWRSRALGKQEWRGDRLVSAGQSWGVLGEISDAEARQGCQCLQRQIGNDVCCICEGRVQPTLWPGLCQPAALVVPQVLMDGRI